LNRQGEYTDAHYLALPVFPQFVIGCYLISSVPEWKCVSQIGRTKKNLNTFPSNNNKISKNLWVVARLLNIPKYTEEDLKSFHDYHETIKVLGLLIKQKANETLYDLDEWGLRRDSMYQPKIGINKGYHSFEGVVYDKNKGGPFRSFIKKYEGKIVYLGIIEKVWCYLGVN